MFNIQPKKLKRAVIKEELLQLTGSVEKAVTLNQFLYWNERMKDVDQYITEELARLENEGKKVEVDLTCGWIYKTAEQLIDETMLTVSRQTMNRVLKSLVEDGYLSARHNPRQKWDRTMQYRVNTIKILENLMDIGYPLEGYALLTVSNAMPTVSNRLSKLSIGQLRLSNRRSTMSNRKLTGEQAIPEITSEITSEINTTSNISADPHGEHRTTSPSRPTLVDDSDDDEILQNISINQYVQLLNEHMQFHLCRPYTCTEEERHQLTVLLDQGIPFKEITAGVDYTFKKFAHRHPNSFKYCAKVIVQHWSEKNNKSAPLQQALATDRDPRYTAFYSLFPDS